MAITLQLAEQQLQAWLDASAALATSSSYKIGSRTLTRSSANEVLKMIDYWQNQVDKLKAGVTSNNRVFRVIPRDL